MFNSELKFISWNLNGLNAALEHGLLDFIAHYDADIYAFQETKATEKAETTTTTDSASSLLTVPGLLQLQLLMPGTQRLFWCPVPDEVRATELFR